MLVTIADIAVFALIILMTWMGASSMQARSRYIFIVIGVMAIVLYSYVSIDRYKSSEKLDEILQIVKRINPELQGLESVDSVIAELKNIELRTTILEKKTKKTVFELINYTIIRLEDGNYESKFTLQPIGKNVVPILDMGIRTHNNAKLLKVSQNIYGVYEVGFSKNRTRWVATFKNLRPTDYHFTVIMDKDPERLDVKFDTK